MDPNLNLTLILVNVTGNLSEHMSYNFSSDVGGQDLNETLSVTFEASTIRTSTGAMLYNEADIYSLEHLILTSIILGIMILATIIGNVFVLAAVLLEEKLQGVANYLVLSLAVADLMVASLVMPISAVNEISKTWFLRPEICDMWISFDVLCCTSSILHLVAIAIDRYWAVTNIDYVRNRSAKRILLMIGASWLVGMCISIPPLFGWKEPENNPRITGMCMISQDPGYTIFSTVGAFYLPLAVILIVYVRIFQVARSRIRKKGFQNKWKEKKKKELNSEITQSKNDETSSFCKSSPITVVTEMTTDGCNGNELSNSSNDNNDNAKVTTNGHVDDETKVAILPKPFNVMDQAAKARRQKEKLEMKRERKAARTLGIITGSFIICWLPFFILALSAPFMKSFADIDVHPILMSIVMWLGYVNSLLNPVIYTVFSPDFRSAFHKILFGKYSARGRGRR
jgi:5-hydroxytryptamine receptor 1